MIPKEFRQYPRFLLFPNIDDSFLPPDDLHQPAALYLGGGFMTASVFVGSKPLEFRIGFQCHGYVHIHIEAAVRNPSTCLDGSVTVRGDSGREEWQLQVCVQARGGLRWSSYWTLGLTPAV